MAEKRKYDVCLSYASEDRKYVRRVRWWLRWYGVKPFYDRDEQAEGWGKSLKAFLEDVYRNLGSYCVVFLSKHYAKKLWTRHELESALASAIATQREYVLPARFDDTRIENLPDDIQYIDLTKVSPRGLASEIARKVRVPWHRRLFAIPRLVVLAMVIAALLAYAPARRVYDDWFGNSHTVVQSVEQVPLGTRAGEEQRYGIRAVLVNRGPKPARVVEYRMSFGTLPIEAARLFPVDRSTETSIPRRGRVAVVLKARTLTACSGGKYLNDKEVVKLLPGQQVRLEADVVEFRSPADQPTKRSHPPVDATRFEQFIDGAVPGSVPHTSCEE